MSRDATEIYDVVPVFAVDETGKALITEEQYSWLCNYAVHKAERVQELEKIKDAKIALVNKGDEERRYVEQERMIELERQNKRYWEALEYIADKPIERGTWTTQGIDCVFTARKALEDSK